MPEIVLTHHDLPPRWDGWPVNWNGWGWAGVILCQPRRAGGPLPDVCDKCGNVAEQPVNRGEAQPERPNGRRILLIAFRCPRCRHDIVCSGSQWWDLEPADYLDAGSTDPTSGSNAQVAQPTKGV
jgi:hypothetical protein